MARLRYNNQAGTLGADPGISGTNLTFQVAPDFATITGSDYIPIALDPGRPTFEIVYLTAYTAGQTTGTMTRAAEDAVNWPAVAHPAGTWAMAPTTYDVGSKSSTLVVAASNSTAAEKAVADYVCTGTADNLKITAALAALPTSGGLVQLCAGDFHMSTSAGVVFPDQNGITLAGTGRRGGSVIHLPAAFAGLAGIQMYASANTTIGGVIRDLYVVGDGDQIGVTAPAIWTLQNEANVLNVKVEKTGGTGFLIDGPSVTVFNGIISNCTATGVGAGSVMNDAADGFVVSQYAADFVLWGNFVNGGNNNASAVLTGSLTNGQTGITSLSVSPLNGALTAGDVISLMAPTNSISTTHTQQVVVSSNAAANATTVAVNSFTATTNYNALSAGITGRTNGNVTRYGFNISGGSTHIDDCHGYRCYESGLRNNVSGIYLFVYGGAFETNGYSNIQVYGLASSIFQGVTIYGPTAYGGLIFYEGTQSSITNCVIDAVLGRFALVVNFCTNVAVTNNLCINAKGPTGTTLTLANSDGCTLANNIVRYYGGGSVDQSLEFFLNTNTTAIGNVIEPLSTGAVVFVGGVNTGSVMSNNPGYNPATLTTPAFPATTVTYTNDLFCTDIIAYVSNGTGTMTTVINGNTGPSFGASANKTVFIPAGGTFTPTYASGSPTWVFQGN